MIKHPVADPATEKKPRLRLPPWFRVKLQQGPHFLEIRSLVKTHNLHTVCEEARCPNIWECWNQRTATFMILGDICTRSCGFCSVATGKPLSVDQEEPTRVAQAVRTLGLRHAVLTSVDRDDLPDGGAEIFHQTIRAVREASPNCQIEVLVPDFKGDPNAILRVIEARPDIFSHNTETVPRLHPSVRPQAKYPRTLEVLRLGRQWGGPHHIRIKTGMMLGLGERLDEVLESLRDLRSVGVEMLTLGQYLQPTPAHLPVERFLPPDEFLSLKTEALALGFLHVESGPLVRSSYHAEEQAEVHPTNVDVI
jgi:lipoic acid synthetase